MPNVRAPRTSIFSDFDRTSLPQGGLAALSAFVADYVRGPGLRTEVIDLLGAMRAGWRPGPDVTDLLGNPGRALPLYVSETLFVQIALMSEPPRKDTLETLVHHGVVAVSSGSIRLRPYRLQRATPDAIPSLQAGPAVVLGRGEQRAFDAHHETYDIADVGTETAVLIASIPGVSSVARRYDRTTLQYRQTVPADLSDARLRFALETIATLPGPLSLRAASAMLDHRSHHVRWAAIETIACLDADRAVEALMQARSDPHPDVRRAAHKSLALVEAARGVPA